MSLVATSSRLKGDRHLSMANTPFTYISSLGSYCNPGFSSAICWLKYVQSL